MSSMLLSVKDVRCTVSVDRCVWLLLVLVPRGAMTRHGAEMNIICYWRLAKEAFAGHDYCV